MVPEGCPNIRFVQVATHSRCNADCVFCPFSESIHAKQNGAMSDELWNRVLDCLAPWSQSIQKFCPYLMQEPLIDKTIFSKIGDIYAKFPNALVEVSSNGAALTDDIIDKLLKSFDGKPHDLWISHHGIDAPTMQHIMQIHYTRATANLIALLKKANGRFRIKIRGAGQSRDGRTTYFTRQQYRDYWERMRVEHDLNLRGVDINDFTFHDRANQLDRADRGADYLKVGKVREIDAQHPFHCGRVTDWIHIQWDGSLRICCMDYKRRVPLPSLKDVTLIEYFQSEAYRTLVGKMTGKIESEDDFICKMCASPGG